MAVRMKLVPEKTDASESFFQYIKQIDSEYKSDSIGLLDGAIKDGVKLSAEGRIIYPDESLGSSIVDMLKYILYPVERLVQKPIDLENFLVLPNVKSIVVSNSSDSAINIDENWISF